MSGKVTNAKEHIGWHKHDTKPGLEILEGSRMVWTPLGPPNVKKNKKGTRKRNVKKRFSRSFLVLSYIRWAQGGPGHPEPPKISSPVQNHFPVHVNARNILNIF